MNIVGPTRLVLLRAGKYDYGEVELINPLHLVGPNNIGKTSLIAVLQFLYIDDQRVMHFSRELAETIMKELEVVTPSVEWPVGRMSGGNVQKVLVGREIAQSPSVLMTAYAVRGLDINTSYTIYNLLTEQKMKGVAVVYVGEDLDVLLELCDRIVVLCGGQVSGVVDARKTDKRQVGVLMTRVEGGKAKNE